MKKFTIFCIALLMGVTTVFSQTIALFEDFESAPYNLTSSGTPAWAINSRVQAAGLYSDSCTLATSSTSYLTSNAFSTVGNMSVILEFSQICKIEMGDAAQIEYSVNGGTTWSIVTLAYYTGAGSYASNKFSEFSYPTAWSAGNATAKPDNTWWKAESFNLSDLVGNQASVMIRFKLNDANNTGAASRPGWFLDDVKVTMAPSEMIPPTVTIIPPIFQDTLYTPGPFQVKAKVSDASGIASAKLVYSVNAGPNDTLLMTLLNVDTFSVNIPAQAYNTRVDYHVFATDASAAANTASSTNYWLYTKQPAPVVIIGTGTSTTNYLPCNGYYNYGWSAQLYKSSEIGLSGNIDSLFFHVGQAISNYTMTNQRIMIAEVSDSVFASGAMPDSASMTTFWAGSAIYSGIGWVKFIPSTPFYYTGVGNLVIYYINRDGSYVSPYPYFSYTATPAANKAKYVYSDTYANVFPTSTGTLTTNRPNLKIAFALNTTVHNVSAVQMTSPLSTPTPVTGTPYDVKIKIKNIGSDTLNNVTINWTVNGTAQTPFAWTGMLLQDQISSEITLGSVTFTNVGNNIIKAWTSNPDGFADEAPQNDTIKKTYYVCSAVLAGTYTIDPLQPTGGTNFKYFADVISTLQNCGVSDTTVFNIAAGTYDTTLTFNGAIPGAGPSACVIFQSASGVNTDVTLRNNASASASNYIVKLNGTSRVQFKNLTFLTQGTSYGTAINLGGGSHYNLFEGNIIGGPATTSTSSNMALIYNSSTLNDTNNVIRNNVLNNGSYGIYFYGVSSINLEKNNTIEGNTLNNFYYYGIYSNYQKGIAIKGNNLRTNSVYSSVIGMYLNYNYYSIVEKNNVVVPTYYGIYLYECDADATTHSRIVNNMVQVGGTSTALVLYSSYCDYVDIFHNTFNTSSTSTSGKVMYIYYGGNLNLKNNFFTNTGAGYALYTSSSSTTYTSDYNNLYTAGATLAYHGSNAANLSAWQIMTLKDSNSVSIAPNYYSATDLHTTAFSTNGLATPLGIIDDIDGDLRSLTTPDMGADEFTPPPFEAELVSAISPLSGCGMGVENVTIRVKNNGSDTINGNFTATYVVNNGTPVTEPITATILPMDTYDFTFATTVDMFVGTGADSVFTFESWVTLQDDTIQMNDSINFGAVSLHMPDSVHLTNATIPYATSTTLTATSADTIQWFADPALTQLLATGTSFTTPVLYDTTVYYVASTSAVNYKYTFDTDLQGWTANTPCASYTTYNWAWASDGGAGTAWMVNPTTYSSAVLQSPVIPVFGDSIDLSFRHRYNTESCCDRGYVAYRIDGGAWTHFTLTTGLYAGSDNLNVDPILAACTSGPTVGTFGGSATTYFVSGGTIPLNGGTQIEIAFAFSSDVSAGYDGWFIDEVSLYKTGCPGPVSPDTVFLTGVPATDLGVIAINEPNSGIELTNAEPVEVVIVNYGSSPATNFNINYQINSLTPVTELYTGTIQPGDTAVYNFTANANLLAFATYSFKAYPTLTGDVYPTNDTAYKSVTNAPLIYCVSSANYTGDEDIKNVTIGSLNNTSPAPHNAMYTDYTATVQAPYLALGQTYPLSVTIVDDASPYYDGYIEAYIDFNHDGVYSEPDEVVFGSSYLDAIDTTITRTVSIPLTAHIGKTGMRVICREGSSVTAATLVPCGTYGYGETEDYFVVLAPQIPYDAGVISIDQPYYLQTEDALAPVVVSVKNFGLNALTSIPVTYTANGGAPVTYTWTGSLAPNDTVQITMPSVLVLADSNSICASTQVVNDTNTFNDQSCAFFFGLPPSIIFEDDFENGTMMYTDAPALWEHGVPMDSVINIAHSPDSCWTTILDGDYPNSVTSGYLYTPNINFFGISGAYMAFYYWIDAEENYDGGYVQYTVNNGATWSSLGDINDPDGFNWYDSYASGTPAWTKNTNGWKPAYLRLDAVSGYSTVKFRFAFKSNASNTFDGFALDDIKILGPAVAIDAGVVDVVTPVGTTDIGVQTTVQVRIKNYGTDTLTSIPLAYTLNTGFPPQNGTWTGSLLPDDTTTFTFTQKYPGPAVNYDLCAYTKLNGDPYKSNDTTCVSLSPVDGIDEASQNGVVLLQNMPNPAADQTLISFVLPEPGTCLLTVRNTLGEVVYSTSISGQTGNNTHMIDLAGFGQGIYMYTLQFDDVTLTRRLSVIR